MSLSIDVKPHALVGGPGFSLEVTCHYYNNSRKDVVLSASRVECELLDANGRVITNLKQEGDQPVTDAVNLQPRQSYDFEFSRFTKHDVTHAPHKLRVRIADSTGEADIH